MFCHLAVDQRCRNRQVKRALENHAQLDTLQEELRSVSDKRRKLQHQNQSLWKELQTLKQQPEGEASQLEPADNSTGKSRLAMENKILKRVVLDIISGSDQIDWYHDERVCQTLMKLE